MTPLLIKIIEFRKAWLILDDWIDFVNSIFPDNFLLFEPENLSPRRNPQGK
jgi:hypothetical protein